MKNLDLRVLFSTVFALIIFLSVHAGAVPSSRTTYAIRVDGFIKENSTGGMLGLGIAAPERTPLLNGTITNYPGVLVIAPTIQATPNPDWTSGPNSVEVGLYTGNYQQPYQGVNGDLHLSSNLWLGLQEGATLSPGSDGTYQAPQQTPAWDVAVVDQPSPRQLKVQYLRDDYGVYNYFFVPPNVFTNYLGGTIYQRRDPKSLYNGWLEINFSSDESQVSGTILVTSGGLPGIVEGVSYGAYYYEAQFSGTRTSVPVAPPTGKSSVSGKLFNDINSNGYQESYEPDLPGWTVKLKAVLGSDNFTTTTDARGNYYFADVQGGNDEFSSFYRITQIRPAGWTNTTPDVDYRNISVAPGAVWTDENFGNKRVGSKIAGGVFHDVAVRGFQFASAGPGLENVPVFLDTNDNGSLDNGEPQQKTNAQGYYVFDELPAGNYTVRMILPGTDWIYISAATWQATLGTDTITEGVDFGVAHLSSIKGIAFEDIDADGFQDQGEMPQANWRIYVDANDNTKLDAGEPNALTDAEGKYVLNFLRPGAIVVREVSQSGWQTSSPFEGAWRAILLSDEKAEGVNFGNSRHGTIAGTVFEDGTGDGVPDGYKDAPLSGWTVFEDADNDGVFDNTSTTINFSVSQGVPDNDVLFVDLPVSGLSGQINDVDIKLNLAVLSPDHDIYLIAPSGRRVKLISEEANLDSNSLTNTIFDDQASITLSEGTDPYTGNFRPAEALSNFNAGDPNGIWRLQIVDNTDSFGEATLQSCSVILKTGEATAVSDANGNYKLQRMAPGAHVVREVLQSGWITTTPGLSATVTVGNGAIITQNFANARPGKVSGIVWNDINGDLYQFDGEPGLSNWRVYIDADNDGIFDANEKSALTNSQGAYQISGLKPGNYLVRQVLQATWRQSWPKFNDGQQVQMSSGETVALIDFGNSKTGAISGHIFNDIEGNGAQDLTDTPLIGWPVYLDSNNNGQFDTTLTTKSSADTPRTLLNQTTSSVSVSGLSGSVLDMEVKLNIQHPVDSALSVFLVTPSGRQIRLFANIGGNGDNFTNTVFNNAALVPIRSGSPPFIGVFQPEEALFLYAGESFNGTWSLVVKDSTAGQAGGVLQNWSLTFLTSTERLRYTNSDGNYSFGALASGTYIVRQINQQGWRRTFPATDNYSVTISTATDAMGRDFGNVDTTIPTAALNDVTITEGNSGTTNATFTVKLDIVSSQAVSLNYATANGTAVATGDYTGKTGTLTIPAGQTTGTITIPIKGDVLDEADESFFVNLTNPDGARISDAQGRCVIVDNDVTPSVAINDVTLIEGDSGTKNATFTIKLSAASGQTVTVNAIPYNGSARTPQDYVTGGARLVFASGETTKTFSVPVKGDLLDEPQENFFVILSSPVNSSIARGRAIGTINDNEAAPSISIDDVRIGEGNVGQRVASFRLKLSAPSGQVVRVSYATAGGTAAAGVDYVAVPATQIAFSAGNLYAYARVLINGDVLNEPDETFNVNLTAPLNATIADAQALGTILNDDSAPSLTINDVSISEGNSGTKNLTFTVTLSKASGQAVTIIYDTADGIAKSSSDYTAKSGTLSFAPASALTRTFSVAISGDSVVEGDETFFVFLSGATNASVGKARGVGTILNDDTSG